MTRLHLIPALGSVKLAKLTARQVQDLYASKRAEGLSPTTVHHIHAVLHAALEYAVRQEYAYRNVSEAAEAPKLRRRKMTAWTAQQARQFLVCAQADRLYGLFVLALATGMRQGELFGLRWQDIDLDTGVINVVHAIRRSRQAGTELAKPKTDSSQRTIAIDANTIAVLQAHRVRQNEERVLVGDAWNDIDLVFSDSTGGPLRGSNVERRHFGPLMAKAGVPRIRFHDLRHTAASIMVANGVPIKVVAEMIGHASIGLTLATYVHVLPTLQRNAAQVLGSALFS